MTRKTQTSKSNALVAGAPAGPAPQDAVSYIRDMAASLREMAEDADQLLLAYLLDMVHEEADLQSRNVPTARNSAVGRA